MRLNQFIAATSALSRRAADTAIAAGRVTVNDQPATLGLTIDPASDRICLDDQPLTPPDSHTYLLFHKPTGYISSRTRQGDTPTLYELLPPEYQNLRFTGRLDRDSSGLMILSDDGTFIHQYTHPSFGKDKHYQLTLDRPIADPDLTRLTTGVMLEDGPSRLTILAAQGTHLTVSLQEGRNRQIRRTLAALGYHVDVLHRTHIGPYQLGDLQPGMWHSFTPVTPTVPKPEVAAA